MSTNAEFDAGPAPEAPAPASSDPAGSEPANGPARRPRPGTIVWGLIIAVLAGLLIAAEYASFSIDMGEVMIGLLIAAGIALIAGGVLAVTAGRPQKMTSRLRKGKLEP